MPEYPDGTEMHQAEEWNRLIGSVPADYTIFLKGTTYYAECLIPDGTDYSGTVKATIQQNAVDALASGGTIYLKEITLDAAVTYGNTILIIEDYQGARKVYSKQGKHLACAMLATDPSTAGWGATQKGYWWFNTTSNQYKYWDGSTIQTLEHGTPAGYHTILSATHTDTLPDSILRGDLLVGNTTPKLSRLAIGAANKVLKSNATDPLWGDPPKLLASYGFYKEGANYYAMDENGNIPYSGSDARLVLEACAQALGTSGGLIRVFPGQYMISKGNLRGGTAFYCGCTIGDPDLNIVAKLSIVGSGPSTIFSPIEAKQRVFTFLHAPDCALQNCIVDGQDIDAEQFPNSADGMVVFDNGSDNGLIEHSILKRGFNSDGAGSYQANNVVFKNNEVYGNEFGLVFTASYRGLMDGNYIHDNYTNGILISLEPWTIQNIITNNRIFDCGGNGIEVSETASYNKIVNNEIQGCERGIAILTAYNEIIGNKCKANVKDAIYLYSSQATDNLVNSNTAILSSDVVDGYGIREASSATNNMILGNKVRLNVAGQIKIAGILTVVRDNFGYNPIGKIASPFSAFDIQLNGTLTVPSASQDYTVRHADILISSTNSGGANNAIIIKDPSGNQINPTPLSTLDAFHIPVGYKINWGAYTGDAPTVVVCFN